MNPPEFINKRVAGRPSTAGFTLLELVVVLVILGMALALIAPDMRSGLDNIRYRTAVRKLAASLRYARSQAVHLKETQEVIINGSEGSYKLSPAGRAKGREAGKREENNSLDESPSQMEGKVVKFPPGLALEEADGSYFLSRGGDTLVISFYAKGSSSGANLLLKGGDLGYRLIVDVVTGGVRISSVEQ